jgi:hypothetical protein
VGDYDYEIQENAAQHDDQDAIKLRADAATLHQESATDYTQADAIDRMGASNEGKALRQVGDALEHRASDLEYRAGELEDSADLGRMAADTLRARDTAAAGASAAEIHAQGAQVVLDFVDLSEDDKTRWTGEAGAATGEASALHQRAEELSNQGAEMGHEVNEQRNDARTGLDGRQWPGIGHPPGESPASGAE